MKYKNIFFDLDGTLLDPGEGITNSVIHALKYYGISVSDRKQLYSFIGPPLWESFEKYFGFSHEKAKEAVEYYREYYREKGIFENKVYDGLFQMLDELKKSGHKLYVATSKPQIFARRIITHFGLESYFDFVGGSELDGTRVKKSEVVAFVAQQTADFTVENTVMVGDREHDVMGAAENGLACIGVLYGYGSYDELTKAGASYIAEKTTDILKYV
ncbi:MAG: HAD family hydrolase [Ruminococcaceae bacterium]|nr:HAD family hydrolase [Oscillospiraceae bacterium]